MQKPHLVVTLGPQGQGTNCFVSAKACVAGTGTVPVHQTRLVAAELHVTGDRYVTLA